MNAEELTPNIRDLVAKAGALAHAITQVRDSCAINPNALPHGKSGEVLANLTLAMRHAEDAQSRAERAVCIFQADF